jgi:hypothetical protein
MTPRESARTINRYADRLLFLDADPDALARAVSEVRAKNSNRFQRAEWRYGLERYPRSGSVVELETWFHQLIPTLVTPTARYTGVTTAAASLALALRKQGQLLLNIGMIGGRAAPVLSGLGRTHVGTWPDEYFTPAEEKLLNTVIVNNSRASAAVFLGAMSPLQRLEDLSIDDVLELIRVLTSAYPRRNSQCPHKIRMMVRELCAQLGIPNRAAEADEILRVSGWKGHQVSYWRGIEHEPWAVGWVALFDRYVATRKLKTGSHLRDTLVRVLRWMEQTGRTIAPNDVNRSWIVEGDGNLFEWLERTYSVKSGMPSRVIAELHKLFEWMQHELGTPHPLRSTDIVRGPPDHGKSTKVLIPTLLLRMSLQVCEELCHAAYDDELVLSPRMWKRFSYLTLTSRTGQGHHESLSPVRPTLLLTLLMIPIRSVQARLLDSGEADEMVPSFKHVSLTGPPQVTWTKNGSALAIPGRKEGVLRLIHDRSAQLAGRPSDFIGFWINTNKTPLQGTAVEQDRGYEIPWQREDLIYYIAKLRDWQSQHNPLRELLGRDQLGDSQLLPPPGSTVQLPKYAYLFRDRVDGLWGDQAPPTRDQIRGLMVRVFAEVQDRLADQGITNFDGTPVKIVEEDERAPYRTPYTLHGLRVAGISALAEAGVPIAIISEFIAGHATVLMTLYYQKFGPATVTRLLNQAREAEASGAHEAWATGLLDAEGLRTDLPYAGSMMASEYFSRSITGLWSIKLDGACPNSQQRCHEGYEANPKTFGAVPGGPQNCPLCRFWVTGPTFVAGQVIAINNLLFTIRKRSEALVQLHQQRREGERGHKIIHAIEGLENQLNIDVSALNARHRLLETSLQLQREPETAPGKHQMIVRTAAEEAVTEFMLTSAEDIEFYDFISQAVEIYPELGSDDAVYRRNQMIDQCLDRDAFSAMFYKMSKQDALEAGNQFTRFLADAYGRDTLAALVDGRKRFGVEVDLSATALPIARREASPRLESPQ